jgi:hypothetical protein
MSLSIKAKEKVWLAGALISPVILLSIFLGFVGYRATRNPTPEPTLQSTQDDGTSVQKKPPAWAVQNAQKKTAPKNTIPPLYSAAKSSDSSPASLVSGILILIGVLALYFLPSIIAHKKRNESAIVTLNLLLGWTVLGWVIALVWALTNDPKIKVNVQLSHPIFCQLCGRYSPHNSTFCASCGSQLQSPVLSVPAGK